MSRHIAIILGTRPEAVKLAPVALRLRDAGHWEVDVCCTGQHREMVRPILDFFGVPIAVDLDLMRPGQTLASLSSVAIAALDRLLESTRPDLVVVQGDTTTVLCAALASFYRGIPVGHVEAGLRTGRRDSPFPEEMNRVLTSRLAEYHFAPTERAREALLREQTSAARIWVTGNPVIDALQWAARRVREQPTCASHPVMDRLSRHRRMVLVTQHRRENLGAKLREVCLALRDLSIRFDDTDWLFPVHPNPAVRRVVDDVLQGRSNVHLLAPLSYPQFVAAMDRAMFLISDSGGVQEEAPALGKPVLVTRDTTERPEAVAAGVARLVGTSRETIVSAATELLTVASAYERMARATNPFGDGRAANRIVEALNEALR